MISEKSIPRVRHRKNRPGSNAFESLMYLFTPAISRFGYFFFFFKSRSLPFRQNWKYRNGL